MRSLLGGGPAAVLELDCTVVVLGVLHICHLWSRSEDQGRLKCMFQLACLVSVASIDD